jgi:hypothetical protein
MIIGGRNLMGESEFDSVNDEDWIDENGEGMSEQYEEDTAKLAKEALEDDSAVRPRILKMTPAGKYKVKVLMDDGGYCKIPNIPAKSLKVGDYLPDEFTLEYDYDSTPGEEAKPQAKLQVVVPQRELDLFTSFVDIDG